MAGTIKNYQGMTECGFKYLAKLKSNGTSLSGFTYKDINGNDHTQMIGTAPVANESYVVSAVNNIQMYKVVHAFCSADNYVPSAYTVTSAGTATVTSSYSTDYSSLTYTVNFTATSTTELRQIAFTRNIQYGNNYVEVLNFAYVFDTPYAVTAGQTYVFNITVTPTI